MSNNFKKKSKSTNVLEIDPNDQHYKRYFNSIYGDECRTTSNKKSRSSIPRKNSLSFQQVQSTSLDETNHKLNWQRLQLSRTKLKQTAKTSALFAGFAMVNLVEVQFNNDPENPVPPFLLIIFGVCSILLVSVHILALMIATCILPNVESIALLENAESASESPHERLRFFIELAWTFSSVIGVFLFLAEVIILVWVKFWEMGQPLGKPGKQAALASTIVFIPFVLIFFFFAIYFYHDFTKNKLSKSTKQIKELETLIVRLEQNDMICHPTMTCNSSAGAGGNSNTAIHNDLNNNRRKYNNSRYQHNMKRKDHSGLFLKNICTRYKTGQQRTGSNEINEKMNDHLLTTTATTNESIRLQSASVDHIDKNVTGFKNDLKNEFKLDDLYRSKVYRNVARSQDCVRFSLDNVNFNTFNGNFSTYNTIQNTIQSDGSAGGGLQDSVINTPFSTTTGSMVDYIAKKSSKQYPKQFKSTKSIDNFEACSTINNDDDQQSNDSNNKIVKKEKSFNNLSAIVI